MTLADNQQERHVGPCKLRELEAVVALLQVRYKEHETYWTCGEVTRDELGDCRSKLVHDDGNEAIGPATVPDKHTDDIKGEGDEAMVRGEWQQKCVNKDNVLEVVDQTLAVEEVIRAEQEVPII
jgi:hypothetical protein